MRADSSFLDVWPFWTRDLVATGTAGTTLIASSTTLIASSNAVTSTNARISSATISNQAWSAWNNTGSIVLTTGSATAVQVWTVWNQAYGACPISEVILDPYTANHVRLPESPEAVERQARIVAEVVEAKERAERLLREHLSPQQRDELTSKGYFHLEILSGGSGPPGVRRRYRIDRGRSRNVRLVDEAGRVLKTLCAHPHEQVPDADTMLAQKLWLETAEDAFLRIANVS